VLVAHLVVGHSSSLRGGASGLGVHDALTRVVDSGGHRGLLQCIQSASGIAVGEGDEVLQGLGLQVD